MDADHTGDVEGQPPTNAAMKFRVGAYGKDVAGTVANNKACDATIWGYDNAPINGKLFRLGLMTPDARGLTNGSVSC